MVGTNKREECNPNYSIEGGVGFTMAMSAVVIRAQDAVSMAIRARENTSEPHLPGPQIV